MQTLQTSQEQRGARVPAHFQDVYLADVCPSRPAYPVITHDYSAERFGAWASGASSGIPAPEAGPGG